MILEINGVDFTDNVVRGTYEINMESEYKSWTDASNRVHRENYRERLKGQTDMIFASMDDYVLFAENARAVNENGTVFVRATANNAISNKAANCWLEFKPKRDRSGGFEDCILQFTLKIEAEK